ncbi:hypothetical protein CLU79DRAFT_179922 [Phycomyces nitens]|nr:hypothetical protein CLU79DRAFT_179922 [Phycomyces nitens]
MRHALDHSDLQELDGLLDLFCSEAQFDLYVRHRIGSYKKLGKIRRAFRDVQQWLRCPAVHEVMNPRCLVAKRLCRELLDYCQIVSRRHVLPTMETTAQLNHEWQILSEHFETATKQHVGWEGHIQNLKRLAKAWKSPDLANQTLRSILALSESDRLVEGTRGLFGRNKAGLFIGFTSREEQEAILGRVCENFESIFAHNAASNLAHVQSWIRESQPSRVLKKVSQFKLNICTEISTESSHTTLGSNATLGTPHLKPNTGCRYSLPIPDFQTCLTEMVPKVSRFKSNLRFAGPLRALFSDASESRMPSAQQVILPSHGNSNVYISVSRLGCTLGRTGYEFYCLVLEHAQWHSAQDSHALHTIGRELIELYDILLSVTCQTQVQRILDLLQAAVP